MLLPKIIQGGLGIHTSNTIARSVSLNNGLGTLTGPCAEIIFTRILQNGDPEGHFREALTHFPFPKIASMVLDAYFVKGGIRVGTPYKKVEPFSFNPSKLLIALTICANYCLVWVAKKGHGQPVSINYLEKLQLPHIFAFTGAMLAGIDVITMGAGIPDQVPGVLDTITRGENPSYLITVKGTEKIPINFDLKKFFGKLPQVKRPAFIPIVSSSILASFLMGKSEGGIQGFVFENSFAGGHSAPPRGKLMLDENNEPIYGPKDEINFEEMKKIGLPFWVGGSAASPFALANAEKMGAYGIQAGSIFALADESAMLESLKREIRKRGFNGNLVVKNNPQASPTMFPFKVTMLEGTLSEERVYSNRKRACDLHCLSVPYLRSDNTIGFRCPAEPEKVFVKKGGALADTGHTICLCNGLISAAGLGSSNEPPIVTLGKDVDFLKHLMRDENDSYSVADAMHYLLS